VHDVYKISDKLVLRFQRRRLKCEKLTDDGCLVDGKSSRCLNIFVCGTDRLYRSSYPCSKKLQFFSSPCQRQRELLPSTRHPSSVNFSHFNLLLLYKDLKETNSDHKCIYRTGCGCK
jgi:hypothetical protein